MSWQCPCPEERGGRSGAGGDGIGAGIDKVQQPPQATQHGSVQRHAH